MRNPTPFFRAFRHLLFGKAPRCFHQKLRARVTADGSLGELRETFGSMIPDALLSTETTGPNSRERLYSPSVTFWAFLAQVLSPDTACREIVRKVQAWRSLTCIAEMSAATSAYCQARARLCLQLLRRIHEHLADRLERNVPRDTLWLGRVVKIVDGTNLSMPDTAENQAAWPQSSNQKPGCGFPMMKLVGLFSLASGALLCFATGTLHVHESQLLRALWDRLHKGDVLLSDRGFCSFLAIASLLRRGVDSVMRLHHARRADFRKGKALGKGDRLVRWTKPRARAVAWSPQDYDALAQELTLRMVRLEVPVKGFRSHTILIVTTLLDPVAYPAQEIRRLYFQRWGVELHFREIKILLRLDVLRCLSPGMIEREVWLHVIAYNLVRSLMQEAAIVHHVDLARISFKGTLDTLRHFADAVHAATGRPRKQAALIDAMLELIAKDQLPLRPGRVEPRAKKRRAKNYHLLTKPRKKMRVPSHRNRPKTALS